MPRRRHHIWRIVVAVTDDEKPPTLLRNLEIGGVKGLDAYVVRLPKL
jgi:hypothetical protein